MPKTGMKATKTGIFRCTNCRIEKTLRKGNRVPPCTCGNTEWKTVRTIGSKAARKKKANSSRKAAKKEKGFFDFLFG